jgi:hypothetical protein
MVPLGYVSRDKKLFIVEGEAERVRTIFQRYLDRRIAVNESRKAAAVCRVPRAMLRPLPPRWSFKKDCDNENEGDVRRGI